MGAMALQRVLLQVALDPNTPAPIKAQLANSYATLEEMKRRIAMRPLAKAVDVTKGTRQVIPHASFTLLDTDLKPRNNGPTSGTVPTP
jgi:hypothetical protein